MFRFFPVYLFFLVWRKELNQAYCHLLLTFIKIITNFNYWFTEWVIFKIPRKRVKVITNNYILRLRKKYPNIFRKLRENSRQLHLEMPRVGGNKILNDNIYLYKGFSPLQLRSHRRGSYCVWPHQLLRRFYRVLPVSTGDKENFRLQNFTFNTLLQFQVNFTNLYGVIYDTFTAD